MKLPYRCWKSRVKPRRADLALSHIQKLYVIEAAIKGEPPDKRYVVRQQETKPVLDKLKTWLDKSLLTVVPTLLFL